MMRMFRASLPLVLLGLTACSVNEVITAEESELVLAEAPKVESQLLDIGIIEFAPGIPANNDPEESGIYNEIREAESRYLAYHLKSTMQGTGHWGAVRVIPSESVFTDVVVSGNIMESDGEFVDIQVSVHDTSGQLWYTRNYQTQTGLSSYSERRDRRQDPYQKVFNDIANDLQAWVDAMPVEDVERLRQISELRFFGDMSPTAFGEHLAVDEDGIASVARLPAENDPSVMRLRRIRERDRLVVDMLNEHYANFYYGIAIPYHSFRKAAREEAVNYRQVKRAATLQTLMGVVVLAGSLSMDTDDTSRSRRNMKRGLQNVGMSQGFNTIMSGISRGQEATMHVEAIQELAESFGAEAAPMVISVEGQARRLTGTATAQYESWRRLLRDIYEAETGFSGDIEVGAPVRAPEPTG